MSRWTMHSCRGGDTATARAGGHKFPNRPRPVPSDVSFHPNPPRETGAFCGFFLFWTSLLRPYCLMLLHVSVRCTVVLSSSSMFGLIFLALGIHLMLCPFQDHALSMCSPASPSATKPVLPPFSHVFSRRLFPSPPWAYPLTQLRVQMGIQGIRRGAPACGGISWRGAANVRPHHGEGVVIFTSP